MLLIAGGALDPHLDRVLDACRRRCVEALPLRVGPEDHPRLTLTLDGVLHLDGVQQWPSGVFLRHDVFAWLEDPRGPVERRAGAWYEALSGYLLLAPEVRCFNRAGLTRRPHKLETLRLARHFGIPVPETRISNDLALLATLDDQVAKPVQGGGLCKPLDAVLRTTTRRGEAALSPAIVQERLGAPEVRAYRVGRRWMPFEVRSDHLDHRDDETATVHPAEGALEGLVPGLTRLTDALGLDLCAVDLKTGSDGRLRLLEVNAQPMFAAFDAASEGALADAIVDALLDQGASTSQITG